MAERRILPPRTNRGRRPQQSEEETARDDALYNQLFQNMNQETKQSPKSKPDKVSIEDRADSAQIEAEARQTYSTNRVYFPYSRGYHYYFDLLSFPRLEGSVSYATDQNNVFNATYSHENQIIKDDLTVGKLFNRKYFGLPIQDVHVPRTRDKNICHGYLFANQDRKFIIDRSIYQLKQILNNFDKLLETGKIRQFICLRKDIDLLAIVQDQLSNQQKKNILKKKIKILSQRKQSMKNFITIEDKNFFYNSLNQRLHDDIQQLSLILKYEFILSEISFGQSLRQQVKGLQQFKGPKLSKLFRYNQFQKICLKQETVKLMCQKIKPNFFTKEKDSQIYEISVPFVFYTFANQSLMTVCQKLLALRLAHQNQASFYMCKIFWKRVFGRDLYINKQMRQLQKQQYDKAIAATMIQMNKWKKQQQSKAKNIEDKIQFPFIDSLVNWQVFQQGSKQTNLFPRSNEVQISGRQFICLSLFYSLYLSVAQIYEFVLSNEIMGDLIASDFFAKAQNYVKQCIGTPRIGILEQTLRRITESVVRSDFDIDFKLKWVYNESLGIAYVIKTGLQSEWETEKQDNQDQIQQPQSQSKDMGKKVK